MRAKTRLNDTTQMVQYGYGWVEGNKLSARYNGKIFAQLPAADNIDIIENGRFLKYDYAAGVCGDESGDDKDSTTTRPGEWLLAFNEVKVYQDRETDADFAMVKDNYEAIVYNAVADGGYTHYIPGMGEILEYSNHKNASGTGYETLSGDVQPPTSTNGGMMPEGTTMVPRLFKTDLGDIMTTNTIKDAYADVNEKDYLVVDTDGYLKKSASGLPATGMAWQVVKKWNMPDLQPGVKIMRVQ